MPGWKNPTELLHKNVVKPLAPDLRSCDFLSSREHNKHALGEDELSSPSSACFARLHETGGRKIHAAAF